jgi:hypothetical protein
MCVVCVLCLIVVPLPQGENPFAVKINNNKNKDWAYGELQRIVTEAVNKKNISLLNVQGIHYLYNTVISVLHLFNPYR